MPVDFLLRILCTSYGQYYQFFVGYTEFCISFSVENNLH